MSASRHDVPVPAPVGNRHGDEAVERGRHRSLREEHKDLTRNRVLDAAVVVFGEKTFTDTTMEDIATAAGVTRVTVYAHFASKGEILRALELRLYAVTDGLYRELAEGPPWTPAVIRAWLDGAAALWRQMAPTIRVLTATLPTAPVTRAPRDRAAGPHERYLEAHRRYVAMLADDPQRWRGVSRHEAQQRVLMAMLHLESFLSIWITGYWPMKAEDPVELLAAAVCHALAPALQAEPLRPPVRSEPVEK